ncbi:MAG: hypothetical protein KC461_04150 [Dehalococcoidia bacterium]|nr:hypothetical protein [Dehalococcoidia bacterium]MCA9849820.1 hypothetical protein [Dehalococcoidia bacterium]MCA9856691.1 hypothetical protein [Dehalococcoidia bacterium]MCB9482633.1 hypothetical protein [Dehalococcoidia bacterium]MCB9491877.1 hypothetical protein [Dehalococcoidia bacterium]
MTTDAPEMAHETSVELTFDDFYVLTADDVDAFAVDWNEEPAPPPFYVVVDGKKFAYTGQTYLVRGYGAELPDWVKAEDAEGHLVLFVERGTRLLAYSYDPTIEEEEDGEEAAE